MEMMITYDPAKRDKTFADRNVDFADAVEVSAAKTLDHVDSRRDYGEKRIVSVGCLRGRMVIVVWTPRGQSRHIISMRKVNEREQIRFGERLGKD